MNFRITTQGSLLLTLLFIAVTSLHVTEGGLPEVRNKRDSGLYSWGEGVIQKIKHLIGEDETTTSSPGIPSQANCDVLTDAQCRAALTQCAVVDVTQGAYYLTWKKDELTSLLVEKEVGKVQAHYKQILTQLKVIINTLVDAAIQNPSLADLQDLCHATGPDGKKETHTDTPYHPPAPTDYPIIDIKTRVPSPLRTSTVPPPVTPESSAIWSSWCRLSEWSQWSEPLGFGTQERVRSVLTPGRECSKPPSLTDYRAAVTSAPSDPKVNMSEVIHHIIDDFIRPSDGKPRDLMLVLDSSKSISDSDFQAMKEGVQVLVNSLCGGFGPLDTQNRLSIVQFSTDVEIKLTFKDSQNPSNIRKVVSELKPMRQFTCTAKALNFAARFFDQAYGARHYAAHDTLIITDGHSNCEGDLAKASSQLHRVSSVYALAIGLAYSPYAVKEITSLVHQGNPHHLFSLTNFRQFQTMAESVKDRRDASQCQPIILPAGYLDNKN